MKEKNIFEKEKTEKLKIGIDIDEVVVEFFKKYLELFNKKFEKNLTFENIVKFNIWNLTDVSREDALKLIEDFYNSEDFFELDLIEGVKDALIKLHKNYEIHFITSRPESVKEKTNLFLKSLFEDIYFNLHFSEGVFGEFKTKAQICKELGIKILIEDRRKYAFECAQNGIKVLLLDKPWNQNCEHENIIRVKNWKEILEKVGVEMNKNFGRNLR